MRRSKKVIIGTVLATVLLVGSIAGIALAQEENTDNTTAGKTLLARVATILGIDQQTVEDAFAQAREEMRAEALDKRLQKLVDEGKITREEADQYKAWWEAKPDVAVGFGFQGRGRFHGRGGMRGFGGMRRFGGTHGHDEMPAPAE